MVVSTFLFSFLTISGGSDVREREGRGLKHAIARHIKQATVNELIHVTALLTFFFWGGWNSHKLYEREGDKS